MENKEVPQNLTCIICYEIFDSPVTIGCGHTFCRDCLRNTLNSKPACPHCRAPCLVDVSHLSENITLRDIIETDYKEALLERTASTPHEENPSVTDLNNMATFRILKQSDVLFPLAKSTVEIEFGGDLAHLLMLCPNRMCILVNEYKEDAIGAQCQIVKEITSQVGADNNDTGIFSDHLKLLVQSINRIRIVNLKKINAAENERFSRSFLGPQREEFFVHAADCRVYRDMPITNEEFAGFQEQFVYMANNISFLLRKLKGVNPSFYFQMVQLKPVGNLEMNGPVAANANFISTYSLNLASIMRMEKEKKIELFNTDCPLHRLKKCYETAKNLNQNTEPTAVFGYNDFGALNFDRILFLVIICCGGIWLALRILGIW